MADVLGKGLDVGTSRLVANWTEGGKEVTNSLRDCYYELKGDDISFIESKGEWKLTTINDRSFALADDAIQIANWLKQEVKRPMAQGVLNPTDDDAYEILEELIGKLLGKPRYPGETCVASIPANSADGEIDTVAHRGAVKQIIQKLGYTFQQINEGYATLLALNPSIEKDGAKLSFTGIAISFGGGMVNLCLAYKSKPLLQVSTSRSGDWVDTMVARTFGKDPLTNQWRVKANEVTLFKEKYFSFGKTYTDAELDSFGFKTPERKKFFRKMMTSLELYYENMLEFTVATFAEKFAEQGSNIEDALEIVISGGTTTPQGFEEKFKEVLDSSDFPLSITGVRKSAKTLTSTASGALVWSMNLEQKKAAAAPKPEPAKAEPAPTPEPPAAPTA